MLAEQRDVDEFRRNGRAGRDRRPHDLHRPAAGAGQARRRPAARRPGDVLGGDSRVHLHGRDQARRGDPRNGASRISRRTPPASVTCSACSRCSRSASRSGPPASRPPSAGCARGGRRSRRSPAARPTAVLGAEELARAQEGAEDARRRALQTGHGDRDGDRAAQLRRGARDRRLGQGRRDRPGDGPDHRLRAAQRDRGLRHRRPAGRRAPVVALAGDAPG